MTDLTKIDDLLDRKFYAHDIDEPLTVRQYMARLLDQLMREGECFSGKRPFGNSGWEDFLLIPAIESGALEGTVDRRDPNYPEAKGWDSKEFRYVREVAVYHAMSKNGHQDVLAAIGAQ